MGAGRPRSFDESEVLEAAMQVFWENGFEGSSFRDLERATGLGRQSLYNTFGDKRALFKSCLLHYEQTRSAGMAACLSAEGSPLAAIERLLGAWRSAADASCNGCLLLNTVAEFRGDDPDLLAVVERVLAAQQQALAAQLGAGQTCGEVRSDLDPRQAARRLQATGHGLLLLGRLSHSAEELDGVVADSLASLRPPRP
jgi:AcrR family transcriptional regulator